MKKVKMDYAMNLPKNIAYFISGHGYGHAVRSARLINALPSSTQVTIFTTIERTFFEREIRAEFTHVELELDCGCVQLGALDVDVSATFEKYSVIEDSRSELLDVCCAHLEKRKVDFVIGDIPPLAFTAAARMGLPSLAVSNFTWLEIYAEFCEEDPRYTSLLASIRKDYANAGCYARLYPGISQHPFRHSKEVGLLCRTTAKSRVSVAQYFDIDTTKKWCLIYFGEFGVDSIPWHRLKLFQDWQFLGLYPLPDAPDNYLQIQLDEKIEHSDVLAGCDLIIGKLGYGLVSECLYWGRPIAYPPRLHFAEHKALSAEVIRQDLGFPLSLKALYSCDIEPAVLWSNRTKSKRIECSAIPDILHLLSKLCQR